MRIAIAMLVLAACGESMPQGTSDAPVYFQPDVPFWLADTGGPVTAIGADPFGAAFVIGGDAPGATLAVHKIQMDAPNDDRLLFEGTGHTAAIAMRYPWIYWADSDAGTIERLPYDGGTPTAIATGLSGVTEVVADADRVYWAAPDGVYAVDPDGENAVVLDDEPLGAPRHLVIDGKRVYWVSDDGTWEMPKGGGHRGFLSTGTAFVGTGEYGEFAVTDSAQGTITAFSDDLRPTQMITAAGQLGPVAVEYPETIWVEGSRLWHHDAETGQQRPIALEPRPITALGTDGFLVYYADGNAIGGTMWVAPIVSSHYALP